MLWPVLMRLVLLLLRLCISVVELAGSATPFTIVQGVPTGPLRQQLA